MVKREVVVADLIWNAEIVILQEFLRFHIERTST
jgi:hypothetical protein